MTMVQSIEHSAGYTPPHCCLATVFKKATNNYISYYGNIEDTNQTHTNGNPSKHVHHDKIEVWSKLHCQFNALKKRNLLVQLLLL